MQKNAARAEQDRGRNRRSDRNQFLGGDLIPIRARNREDSLVELSSADATTHVVSDVITSARITY